jgi:hypothetical protein
VSLSMGFLRSCASCTPSCPAFISSECTDNFAPGGLGGPELQVSGRARQRRRARARGCDGGPVRPAAHAVPSFRSLPFFAPPTTRWCPSPRRRAWRCL